MPIFVVEFDSTVTAPLTKDLRAVLVADNARKEDAADEVSWSVDSDEDDSQQELLNMDQATPKTRGASIGDPKLPSSTTLVPPPEKPHTTIVEVQDIPSSSSSERSIAVEPHGGSGSSWSWSISADPEDPLEQV